MDKELVILTRKVLKKYSYIQIAEKIDVAPTTIKKWVDTNNVPNAYKFDFMKLLKLKIDYTKYDSKDKDQFYTPLDTARKCYKVSCEILKQLGERESSYTYIEPSAGGGTFIQVLPKSRTIGMDIEPNYKGVKKQDYLEWKPHKKGKYIVIGNPPFGLRGNLALRFINHSSNFADFVCFILPQLFESDGKGVPRKRVTGYNLIYSKKLDSSFYEPNKNSININTVFQIWSKKHKNNKFKLNNKVDKNIKIYSVSDGGTPSTIRNKDMINKCDIYLPSTCFGMENMKYYTSFNKLPGKKGYGIVFNSNKKQLISKFKKIDWTKVAFLSTNSACNIRTSQITRAINKKYRWELYI